MKKKIPVDKIVDFASGRLSREESLAILDVVEEDEQASADFEMVTSIMGVVEEEGAALSAERSRRQEKSHFWLWELLASLGHKFRVHPVLSGAASFAIVLALLMIMVPHSSPYGVLASTDDFDFGATVRGVDLEDFEVPFAMYGEGKYEESIRLFERYIRAYPRSGLLEYAHYSAGAAYLRWSEWRVATFFIGFDRNRVMEGVKHLEEAVRISSNRRLQEDARWLLAKSDLMLTDVDAAAQKLRAIALMNGSRREEAVNLIQALERAQQQR
jgi:hypothetical protein